MKRNVLGWGLVIIVVVGFLVLLGVEKKPEESFSELVVSKDKWYELMSARERTNEGMVERVRLNGEELMTAGSGTRWYYSVVEGQANAKDPKVDYRTGVGAKLAILESGITDEMIREGEGVKVMAYTGEKYEIYELFVTTLPLLSIDHTGMRDMAKSDSEETMWLKLFDNRAETSQPSPRAP